MRKWGMSRQKIHFLSRNRSFLFRFVIAILGLSFLVALASSTYRQAAHTRTLPHGGLVPWLEKEITGNSASAESIADTLRQLHFLIGKSFLEESASPLHVVGLQESLTLTALEDLLAKSPLDASERQLFTAYLNARFADDSLRSQGREYVETHARMTPPQRFANEFLGDLLLADDKIDQALHHFEKEAALPNTNYARQKILNLVLLKKDPARLKSLLARDSFAALPSPRQRIEIAVILKDWRGLLPAVVAYDHRAKDNPERILTLFAAAVWFLIVIQFGRFSFRRLALYLFGILAGVASGTATLYVLILQENVGGMNTGANTTEQIIYFIVGVALREEIIKLAFFSLAIPFLFRRKNAVEALLVAACVGLGFALQENVNYYKGSDTIALTRFVTANFFHLAATGIIGLAFFQMITSPKRHWEEFLATFIGVVLAHGAYNSLLAVPGLGNYSILNLIIFVLLAQRFFLKAGELRDANVHTLAPLAVFLVGSAILIGVVLNYAAWHQPFSDSLLNVGAAVLSVVPVAFVFINQFRND